TRQVEDAGADGIELNFSCPHGMPEKGMGMAIGQVPETTLMMTEWVKAVAKKPVMVKLTPNVTDICIIAKAAKKGGANALATINTIQSLCGVNLDTLEPLPTVEGISSFGGYSGPAVKPIALRLVTQLAQDKDIGLPISGIGGISTWQDAAEFILLGATTVQVCTGIMRAGYRIVEDMADGLLNFMDEKSFNSIDEMCGRVLSKIVAHEKLPRHPRIVSSVDTGTCTKCDLCYITCQDGGHQAITLDKNRLPVIDEEKCAGCGMCALICPVPNCVTLKKK
ncbi:MAG: NAD-dependent dihydropyrimidine dehydrogenase subunit PreA, partial [Elusimicrobiota bacterium]